MKALLVAFADMQVAPLASYSARGEHRDRHPGGDDPDWQRAPDKNRVLQMINGRPRSFATRILAIIKMLKGRIAVETDSDDNIIGCALGDRDRDQDSVAQGESDVLIDRKQATQENSRGSVAEDGMAVSLVTAPVSGGDNVWGHLANAGGCPLVIGALGGATYSPPGKINTLN